MTIWEHLAELRRRLTIVIAALFVAVCILYFFAPSLISFLIDPVAEHILNATQVVEADGQAQSEGTEEANAEGTEEANAEGAGQGSEQTQSEATEAEDPKLQVLTPLGGFTLRFIVALFFAIVFTSPVWIWQLMAFFLPALKSNERRWVLPTFFIGVTLFTVGVVFCYLFILNPAFEWMLDQTNAFAIVLPNATDYIMLILLFEIAFGFAFQLPLIVFYLLVFNIIPYKKLRKNWRIVYIVLLVFCAMITPDASPVTLILLFFPMAVLYEISLALSRIVLSKRIKAKEAEAAAEEAAEEALEAEKKAKREALKAEEAAAEAAEKEAEMAKAAPDA
ncbi:MAG: twin-arginine translocase subunit TatC [Coriobacteriia bacterium]|nr:twin-arginine translocase subunit TatC [Coriobacteriia bacterium]